MCAYIIIIILKINRYDYMVNENITQLTAAAHTIFLSVATTAQLHGTVAHIVLRVSADV